MPLSVKAYLCLDWTFQPNWHNVMKLCACCCQQIRSAKHAKCWPSAHFILRCLPTRCLFLPHTYIHIRAKAHSQHKRARTHACAPAHRYSTYSCTYSRALSGFPLQRYNLILHHTKNFTKKENKTKATTTEKENLYHYKQQHLFV